MTKREYKDRGGQSNTKEYKKFSIKKWRDRQRLLVIKNLVKGFHKAVMAILKNIK